MEVLYIDIFVWCCLALAPEEEAFLGGHLLYRDVLDGEPGDSLTLGREIEESEAVPEDDGPDHTQGHLDISIHDLLGTNGHKLHTLAGDEVQGLVHICNLVEPVKVSIDGGRNFYRSGVKNFDSSSVFYLPHLAPVRLR